MISGFVSFLLSSAVLRSSCWHVHEIHKPAQSSDVYHSYRGDCAFPCTTGNYDKAQLCHKKIVNLREDIRQEAGLLVFFITSAKVIDTTCI